MKQTQNLWTCGMHLIMYLEAQLVHMDCVMYKLSWQLNLLGMIYSKERGQDYSLRKMLFPASHGVLKMAWLLIPSLPLHRCVLAG